MSNRWNQNKFSTLNRLYIWGHRWILVLLLIFVDWHKHSNTNVAGSKCILFRFWCIIWRPKAIFDKKKYPHYIMGYIINLGSLFFQFSLVLNLAYIDYSLCHIWSAYMQYLRCCDHSNKCLFLVIQQAEVLLNFFWWVYTVGIPHGRRVTYAVGTWYARRVTYIVALWYAHRVTYTVGIPYVRRATYAVGTWYACRVTFTVALWYARHMT